MVACFGNVGLVGRLCLSQLPELCVLGGWMLGSSLSLWAEQQTDLEYTHIMGWTTGTHETLYST